MLLEAEAEAELDRPVLRAIRSDVLVVYHTKGTRRINVYISVATVGTTGVLRHKVVENVNELERERRAEPFSDPEVLGDGRIQIPEREPSQHASATRVASHHRVRRQLGRARCCEPVLVLGAARRKCPGRVRSL